MGKSNKTQTACAARKESAASSISGAIQAINEAANRLERLSQTGNFAPIPHLASTITRNFNRGQHGEYTKEEQTALAKTFSNAVATLHNVVFDRETASLFALRSGYEKWMPLTQCLCTASSRTTQHRLKTELLSLIHTAADIESAAPDLARPTLPNALTRATDAYERLRIGHRWEGLKVPGTSGRV